MINLFEIVDKILNRKCQSGLNRFDNEEGEENNRFVYTNETKNYLPYDKIKQNPIEDNISFEGIKNGNFLLKEGFNKKTDLLNLKNMFMISNFIKSFPDFEIENTADLKEGEKEDYFGFEKIFKKDFRPSFINSFISKINNSDLKTSLKIADFKDVQINKQQKEGFFNYQTAVLKSGEPAYADNFDEFGRYLAESLNTAAKNRSIFKAE